MFEPLLMIGAGVALCLGSRWWRRRLMVMAQFPKGATANRGQTFEEWRDQNIDGMRFGVFIGFMFAVAGTLWLVARVIGLSG